MSNVTWAGCHPPYSDPEGRTKQHWSIELQGNEGFEGVHAENCRVEGGALIFTNGDIFTSSIVAAYSPGRWAWCAPCSCPYDQADDDED